MKKISILLVAMLIFGLVGCGNGGSGTTASATLDKEPLQLLQAQQGDGPVATIKTSMGDIQIELFPAKAPKAVENFMTHAKNGYYDGLIFHRVIDGFMLQGGDPLGTGTGGESIWGEPFEDEFSDSLRNFRGALSMANSGTDTNGSQFFIVQAKDAMLNNYVEQSYASLLFGQAQRRIYQQAAMEGMTQDKLNAFMKTQQEAYDKQVAAGPSQAYKDKLQPVIEHYKTVGGTPHLDNKHTVFGQVISGMDIVDAIAAVEVVGKGVKDKPATDVTIISIEIKE